MAAPPLPPKGNSTSWTKDNKVGEPRASDTFLTAGSASLPPRRSSLFDNTAPVSQSMAQGEAPPLPPRPSSTRNWDQSFANPLSIVPPPPGKGRVVKPHNFVTLPMKNLPSNFLSSSGHANTRMNLTAQLQAVSFDSYTCSNMSRGPILHPSFNLQNVARLPDSPALAFVNSTYQASVIPLSNGFDIHHSRSAPDLANPAFPCVPQSSIPNNASASVNNNCVNNFNAFPSIYGRVNQPHLEGVLKFMKKKRDSNLIDLYCSENDFADFKQLESQNSHIDDVLKLFDPLLEVDETASTNKSDSISVELPLVKEVEASKPAMTNGNINTVESLQSREDAVSNEELPVLQNIVLSKVNQFSITCNKDIVSFCEKLQKLRSEFSYDDYPTNAGLVISPTLDSYQEDSLSIQLVIHSIYSNRPVSFTCDVSTSIEHIVSHAVCSVLDDTPSLSMDNFILKVYGLSEYFSAHSILADYEYVHQCHKFDKPVLLSLIDIRELKRPLARTRRDDVSDVEFNVSELIAFRKRETISYESLNILIETVEKEIEKIKSNALKFNGSDGLCPQGVVQAVKAICTLLSHVETAEVTDAVSSLIEICLLFRKAESSDTSKSVSFSTSVSDQSDNKLLNQLYPLLELGLQKVQQSIQQLLNLYAKSFDVDFEVQSAKQSLVTKSATDFLDTLLLHISILHGVIPSVWSQFGSFNITCEICYGQTTVASITTKTVPISKSFFSNLSFDEWLQFEAVSMCTLPREAVLYFTLWGFDMQQVDSSTPTKSPLGWCGVRLFNYDDEMLQGNLLLGLWPADVTRFSGPLCCNPNSTVPLLQIGLPEFECVIKFPNAVDNKFASYQKRNFDDLEQEKQRAIMEIIERDVLSPLKAEEKELLWEKRNYLHKFPQALPKVLLSAHGWDWACLSDIYSLMKDWHPLSPVEALSLLMPCFPDRMVRSTAISWMKNIVSDELCDYLPQMVQVLRYEAWDDSPTAWFLLERSLTSIRVAHHLYWLLKQNTDDPVAGRRMLLIQNALILIIGSAMRKRFESQEALLSNLSNLADRIKTCKESMRLNVLLHELEITHHTLVEELTCLPLSPSLEVCGIDVKCCSYFTSNTLPLKISFCTPETGAKSYEAIYKAGDDLRQDMITLQMIRIMDKLWLKDGLDLKIVTFMCVATEFKKGMVELVPESETLRKIQTELGLTGSFKDRSIAEWLQKYNTSELEYKQAVENFTLSCAGYCVATYILGICDRHNDNIMLKTSGHIFHIDFGKFLGDAQMFGNIKRDRTPFVLTSDMAYVINGGDKPSKKFQYFIDLCCQAFNIIRKNSGIFLNLFSLMVSSGVPGLTQGAVTYIRKALMPDLSEAEAMGQFNRMIQDSLKSWFTQFNFFIHNLAQLRFTGDHNDGLLLSFIPKVYSKEMDGKITDANVIGYRKMYDTEKYYIYVVDVVRQNSSVSSCILRTYREFIEFHQKMCLKFPLAKFHPLPGNPLMGRTNVRDVADRRKEELKTFVSCLFKMAEEIAHCDLVYTFFHPMLRDQEGMADAKEERACLQRSRRGSSVSEIYGQIKLSVVYKNKSLFIMVMHAKNLNSPRGTAPDPYVKTYLLPDPSKLTKRKTKTVYRNCHPTFMEMLVYALPLEVVRHRTLYVSVWNYDRVQENEFMGAVLVPLSEGNLSHERVQWYQLRSLNH